MTALANDRSTAAPTIPRPRHPQPDTTGTTGTTVPQEQPDPAQPDVPELPVAEYPWPEPWRYSRGARPRSEFWDVATASWHSRGPYPDRSSAG
jgi:hypothetical protein